MHDQLSLLLERASRYRNLARTVAHEEVRRTLLMIAAEYVALVQLLVEQPMDSGSGLPEALAAGGVSKL